MPEFCLEGRDSRDFRELPEMLRGYIEAAFFTAPRPGEYGDDSEADSAAIPEEYGFPDLAPDALESMRADVERFALENAAAVETLTAGSFDLEQIGRDFWFTRNHHGVGFWDRDADGDADGDAEKTALDCLDTAARTYGETDLIRGDDSAVYVSP